MKQLETADAVHVVPFYGATTIVLSKLFSKHNISLMRNMPLENIGSCVQGLLYHLHDIASDFTVKLRTKK